MTKLWWRRISPKIEPVISKIVLDEISQGDQSAAATRMRFIEKMMVLEVNPQVLELAERYFRALQLPTKAEADALHLAMAAVHQVDFLVTWNCVHMASGRVRKTLVEINRQAALETPIICTPQELMEV